MGRAPCCDKANVKKGPWSPEEDAKLKTFIEKYGTGGNWIALPRKIGLKRCGKSCRLRWLNYLRPNIKHGEFTEEEDNIICSLYISIGSRWSIIAAQLPGRTDNDIKNYWNTRLKKKLLGKCKQSKMCQVPFPGLDPKDGPGEESAHYLQDLSSSALERLQLHMQLHSLENPFSLWPKLNPLQQKMIQTLLSPNDRNQNINNLMRQNLSGPQPAALAPEQDYRTFSTDGLVDAIHCLSSSESSRALSNKANILEPDMGENTGICQLPGSGFSPAEIDDLLSNKPSSFQLPAGNQISEFDCFKEVDGSRDINLACWSNEFDVNSTSPDSWDSATMLHQSEEIYQDYCIGYNMH